LDVESVRIVSPAPGDPYLYVEDPNKTRETVLYESLKEALKASDAAVPMALGKDVNGESIVIDAASAQHLLLLGDSGSGKTECIHGLVKSVLDIRTAD
jgi:S-DNA-T family DNA segregation ATPase FtsK/SpoIIIE